MSSFQLIFILSKHILKKSGFSIKNFLCQYELLDSTRRENQFRQHFLSFVCFSAYLRELLLWEKGLLDSWQGKNSLGGAIYKNICAVSHVLTTIGRPKRI